MVKLSYKCSVILIFWQCLEREVGFGDEYLNWPEYLKYHFFPIHGQKTQLADCDGLPGLTLLNHSCVLFDYKLLHGYFFII